ncbi:hypothetical protein GCM10010869_13750 [Mesorhizobium tianshanense]|uniref:DDE family transposase n=1 Tax=Mesorhizobium tianshanense TaxID=39844 RepID=A0A562MZA2_9HYPH|nr:hypothetical protein IQ26_06167 [Mesorhizobium tianshanense]GLS35786.1 hypothetical protein GCM10010869_13750 [Mesorhizobium tianshanense]
MPGEEVWLVGERRSTGEQKYHVSNPPADATIKALAATIKADGSVNRRTSSSRRNVSVWITSKADPWTGLHRHALMTMIAYAFLQSRRLKAAGRKKESQDRLRNQPCQLSGK